MKNLLTIYKGREKMTPSELDQVRSHRGVQLVLTIDTQEQGRQLFLVPIEYSLVGTELHFDVLGDFVIEAGDSWCAIEMIRLSVFINGEYRGPLKLNGVKMLEKLMVAPGKRLTIRADTQMGTQLTDYVMTLEQPNFPMG